MFRIVRVFGTLILFVQGETVAFGQSVSMLQASGVPVTKADASLQESFPQDTNIEESGQPSVEPSVPEVSATKASDTYESPDGLGFLVGATKIDFPDNELAFRYVLQRTRLVQTDGRTTAKPVFVSQDATIKLNANLVEFFDGDLPSTAKRTAVLLVAATRHPILIKMLKESKQGSDQELILTELKRNYAMHYGIECWWRKQKLDELEREVAELKAKLQQRVASRDAYVKAAMTIADLYADGVSAPPPVPAMPAQRAEKANIYYGGETLPGPVASSKYGSTATAPSPSPLPNAFPSTPRNFQDSSSAPPLSLPNSRY